MAVPRQVPLEVSVEPLDREGSWGSLEDQDWVLVWWEPAATDSEFKTHKDTPLSSLRQRAVSGSVIYHTMML